MKKIKLSRIIDSSSTILFLFLSTVLLIQLIQSTISLGATISLLLAALFTGYILADFFSGIVHWAGDRYGSIDTPLLGKQFLLPVRAHHLYPKDMTKGDFITVNGNSCFLSFFYLLLIWALFSPVESSLFSFFVVASSLSATLLVAVTNQFHKWAHTDNPPALAKWLQKHHLILHPEHHDIHHTSPFETHYCITRGILNKPLAKIRFFETLETLIFKITGVKAGDYNLDEIKEKYQATIEGYFDQK